jgi:hypothetical protein
MTQKRQNHAESEVSMTDQRFVVETVLGMGAGAGMFVVIDMQLGEEVSKLFYFEDEANRVARRLQAKEQA